jgi:hypothetical protein
VLVELLGGGGLGSGGASEASWPGWAGQARRAGGQPGARVRVAEQGRRGSLLLALASAWLGKGRWAASEEETWSASGGSMGRA